MILQTDPTCQQLLTGLSEWLQSAGPLWCKLYQNRPTLQPDHHDPAQFVEATFSGYMAVNVNGSVAAPFRQSPGRWKCDVGPARFAHSGGLFTNQIKGCWLQRGSVVVFAAEFRAPVLMQAGSAALVLYLRLTQEARFMFEALQ